MGFMRHNAIIVSSGYGDSLDTAHTHAKSLAMTVTDIVESPTNGVRTFLVAPDGSKEHWEASENGDARRASFIQWMTARRYVDGSSPLDWVEVQYGDDNGETLVKAHSDEEARYVPGLLV